jgi:PKD repeat protein
MKKFVFTLITLFCAYLFLPAQTTDACKADFTYSVDGYTVKFSSSSPVSNTLKHYWEFGDGKSAEGTAAPVHVYAAPGAYRVLHYVKNSAGNCYDSVSKVINIGPANCTVQAKFEWKQDAANCLKVQFINKSVPISPNVRFFWKFGDGGGSYDINPSHVYNQPGEYEVSLVVDAGNNCTKTYTEKIKIICEPVCNILPDFKWEQNTTNCLLLYFYNKTVLTTSAAKVTWNFGDGTTSNEWNAKHEYKEAGIYDVTLVIEISNTCRKEISKKVEIRCPAPCTIEPKFEWKIDPAQPHVVYFKNLTVQTPNAIYFKWTFGDGTGSAEVNPVHKYEKPGVYKVCLIAETANGCRKEYCAEVTVKFEICNIQPKFEWKIDPAQPHVVYFNNLTVLPANDVKFKWIFGDGHTSAEVNPVHKYENPGVYKVCLIAETSNGCRKEYCAEVIVRVDVCNIEPKFEWKRDEQHPNKIYFYNLTAPVTANVKFKWVFGDGTTSDEKNPVHVYQQPGIYKACLIIETSNGCHKEVCQEIGIRLCNVKAKYEWKKDQSQWNKIHFANLSEPVSRIWRTTWSYGDGTASNDFNTFHTYSRPGVYRVCLKVQSLDGCISEYCDTVVVRNPDVINCEGQSNFKYGRSANNLLEYKFEPEHKYSNRKYYWSFGDGTVSNDVTPVHKFPKAGIYKVCLTVAIYNTTGTVLCRSTTCKEIKVGPDCENVKVKFEYKHHPNQPNKVSFYATGTEPIIKQKWIISYDTANGIFNPWYVILEQKDPTYTFKEKGWYVVTLKAVTASGCEKSYTERIYIEKLVNAPITGSISIPVYPNPAKDKISFNLKVEVTQTIKLSVLSNTGVKQLELEYKAEAGNNVISIPVEKLTPGLYYIEIRVGSQVYWAKFQKL